MDYGKTLDCGEKHQRLTAWVIPKKRGCTIACLRIPHFKPQQETRCPAAFLRVSPVVLFGHQHKTPPARALLLLTMSTFSSLSLSMTSPKKLSAFTLNSVLNVSE
ncbi:MAG: hypothetical protein NZM04_02215 [Methylacidiphilales bacterium]|nr:hypothetical protein [Candidatus Methylacidiphilales bacterium]MDW8350013.1 hypothetical protein [Verrucomicrobiae bacterium]